jgi:hypothetical protein
MTMPPDDTKTNPIVVPVKGGEVSANARHKIHSIPHWVRFDMAEERVKRRLAAILAADVAAQSAYSYPDL